MQNSMVGGTQLRGSYCDLCICMWNTMFMYLAQCCLIRKFLWLLLHFSLSQMVLISKCSGPQCSVKNDQESTRTQIWRSISGLYSCISRGKTLNYCKQMTGRVDLGWLIMKNVYNISVHAILQVGTCHLVFHSVWNSFFIIYYYKKMSCVIFSPNLIVGVVGATLNNCKISWSHQYNNLKRGVL